MCVRVCVCEDFVLTKSSGLTCTVFLLQKMKKPSKKPDNQNKARVKKEKERKERKEKELKEKKARRSEEKSRAR